MYTVKYEEYVCDYDRRSFSKTFQSLYTLEDWMFGMMQQSYERMWFPVKEPSRIEIDPGMRCPKIWIYYIQSDKGIEFTDGKYTNGQKHWSKEIHDWLIRCNERKKAPKFCFVE